MNDGSNRPGPKPGVYGRTKLERFDQSSAPDARRSGKTRGRTLTMAELRDRADESSVASAPFASHFHPSKVRSLPEQAESASAIILSAGRGSRLLPLTESLPKCLLSVGGRSVVEWQLGALAAAGVPRATVVVGFGADKVRNVLACSFSFATGPHALQSPLRDRRQSDQLLDGARLDAWRLLPHQRRHPFRA